MKRRPTAAKPLHIVLVGAGNIGSFLADLLARHPRVGRLTIVDRDAYTESNLTTQHIEPRHVGRSKAHVVAEHARRIGGSRLMVEAWPAELAALPWGLYRRADQVIGCLDSHRARIELATICWRTGRTLLDCGVNAEAQLARVTRFSPETDRACYVCTIADWSEVEGTFTCGTAASVPTGAPAYLGAVTAALAAARLWNPDTAQEVVFDLRTGKTLASRYERNPACRFDHDVWQVKPLPVNPRKTTWEMLLRQHSPRLLSVAGETWITESVCSRCGLKRNGLLLLRRRSRTRRCRHCGGTLAAPGFGLFDQLPTDCFPTKCRKQPLAACGIQDGDILTFDRTRHFEIQTSAS